MQTGLYVSLSSQLALDRRLTTLADNVANSTTVGFRATEVKFNQVVSDQKVADVAFVSQGNEFISTRSGGIGASSSLTGFPSLRSVAGRAGSNGPAPRLPVPNVLPPACSASLAGPRQRASRTSGAPSKAKISCCLRR